VSGATGRDCAREVLRDGRRQDPCAIASRRALELRVRTSGPRGMTAT
jgi:hypothetical protein